MKLLLTLPYHNGDAALLKKNLAWMRELAPEGYHHSCLLVADVGVGPDQKLELLQAAKALFETANGIEVQVPKEKAGWPQAPNFVFESAARQIAEVYRLPWLWFEPDATPLMPNWLDKIAEAYDLSARRFLGSIVPSNGQIDMPPLHLAGCAVYDTAAYHGMRNFTSGKQAFDIAAASYTVARATNYPGMQHFWGQPDLAPTFTLSPTGNSPKNTFCLDSIEPQAVMFHRCKDGTLIDCLREKAQSRTKVSFKPRKWTHPAQIVSEAVSP